MCVFLQTVDQEAQAQALRPASRIVVDDMADCGTTTMRTRTIAAFVNSPVRLCYTARYAHPQLFPIVISKCCPYTAQAFD